MVTEILSFRQIDIVLLCIIDTIHFRYCTLCGHDCLCFQMDVPPHVIESYELHDIDSTTEAEKPGCIVKLLYDSHITQNTKWTLIDEVNISYYSHRIINIVFRGYKMYNFRIKTICFSPEMPKARAKKSGFNLIILHFYIRRKLDITLC